MVSSCLYKHNTGITYRTVEHRVALITALLDVGLQLTGIQRFQELKAAQQLCGYRHDSAPIIELAAILGTELARSDTQQDPKTHIGC